MNQSPLVEAQWKDEGQQSQGHKEKNLHCERCYLLNHGIRESVASPPSAQSPEQPDLPLELVLLWAEDWARQPPEIPSRLNHPLSQWLTRELAHLTLPWTKTGYPNPYWGWEMYTNILSSVGALPATGKILKTLAKDAFRRHWSFSNFLEWTPELLLIYVNIQILQAFSNKQKISKLYVCS